MKIVFSNYLKNVDPKLVGGKAYNLIRLCRWGFQVPPFAVLTTNFFDEYQKKPEVLIKVLALIKRKLGNGEFAVRSSMIGEDGSEHSFAGIMESYLHVKEENLESMISTCFLSQKSARVRGYWRLKKIDEEIKAAVIIQQMIKPDVGGVAFSRSPKGNSALTYIESTYGYGAGVASGLVDVDSFWCDRFGHLVKKIIPSKDRKVVLNSDAKIDYEDVAIEKKENATLCDNQVLSLNEKLLLVEEKIGVPCDLEWAISNGDLFLLQVRPITQKFPELRYYVDTNLAESYPGITSRLTGSFVERIYTKTFIEAIQKLTMTAKVPSQLSPYFETLVAYVGGHLYYNLTSYYAVLMALPGGKVNIENWHRMHGGQPDKQLDLSKYYCPGLFSKAKIIFSISMLVLFHKQIFDDFYDHADEAMEKLNLKLKQCERAREKAKLILVALNAGRGFSLTILNDLLIMGTLKMLSWGLKRRGLGDELLADIINVGEIIESIKPLQELDELVKLLEREPESMEGYKEKLKGWDGLDSRKFYKELFEEGQAIWTHKMKAYLDNFGDRSFEELKLESMSFSQDPSGFFDFLTWKMRTKFLGISVEPKEGKIVDVDKMGFIFKKTLHFCRRVIATREKTRLIRGRFYGWVRSAFIQFSEDLIKEERDLYSNFEVKDFFNLTFDDLEGFVRYADYNRVFQTIVDRKEKAPRRLENYPEFFCHPHLTEDEAYFFMQKNESKNISSLDPLSGMGVSKGIVQGEALVLSSPLQAMELDQLDNKILVTKNTDPAWIFIMVQCRGLISEKGSLLSHSAIIGRELGIPTVVGVKDATQKIINGAEIEIDGTQGSIRSL